MNKTAIMESQTKEKAAEKAMKRIREEKTRRKDDKSVDHVLKALDSLGTTEEKLGAMCQKYAEMFNDHRLLQNAVKQAEKKNTILQKEKEQLQAEHSKAILTRSRLENLCRELQRQNKAVKEECMLKMREEGEKKREVAAKFHSMLSEIGSLLAQNSDKNAKLRDDNLDMSMRLKSVCDQFEKKEQHVENLAKQMQLEMQLADAKLAKAKMEMDIEKETLQKEKQQLLIELSEYKRRVCEMKASELALREQITMYSEKYEEFHKALLQSNSAIGDFKAEMERMTKHIRRLEKETATWKYRYDAAQRTLAEMTEGKIRSDEALGLAQRRLTALQGICRGLQDQCRQLRGEKKVDPLTEEEYQRLEGQIKDIETTTADLSIICPRTVSHESTKEEDITITNVIGNENETLVEENPESMNTLEEVSVINSDYESSQENELDITNINSNNDCLENNLDKVLQESHVDVATNDTDIEENRLRVESSAHENPLLKACTEENHKLENCVLENTSNIISYNDQKPITEEHYDTLCYKENINNEVELYKVDNLSGKVTNSLENSPNKTLLELIETLTSPNEVEINVPNLLNSIEENALKELSISEKHLKDIEEMISTNAEIDNKISALRNNDMPIIEEANQLNGEMTTENSSSCCDEARMENSEHQKGNFDKVFNNPEEVNQTKSKKKRKMKK